MSASLSGPSLAHLIDLPHVVYEVWAGDVCLYVGMTFNLKGRMSCHRSRSNWALFPHEVRVSEYPNRPEAEFAEAKRIYELRPANNLRVPARMPTAWPGVTYHQRAGT